MSFCAEVKAEALGVQIKKSCCRRAFIVGTLFLGSVVQDDAIVLHAGSAAQAEVFAKLISEQFGRTCAVQKGKRSGTALLSFESHTARLVLQQAEQAGFSGLLKCPECAAALTRGFFIGGGTMNSPDKQYHLELKARMRPELGSVSAQMAACGFSFKTSYRLGVETLYMKENAGIEDFLFLSVQTGRLLRL